MRKFFDKNLHDKYDKNAKNEILKIFKSELDYNFELIENPKTRGVDILVHTNGDHIFNIETEVKTLWKEEFKYDTVQFPERKEKFAKLEKPTLFVMFNNDYSQFLTVSSKDLLSAPKKMVRNRYVRYGELFYQVPLEKVLFNDLKKSLINLRGEK